MSDKPAERFRKCRVKKCKNKCRHIHINGKWSGDKVCSEYCREQYKKSERERHRKNTLDYGTARVAKLNAKSRETGQRVDWPLNYKPEPEWWVERELAKVKIDERPWKHRCNVCHARVREPMESIEGTDGRWWCDFMCYDLRVTDEALKDPRRNTNHEHALYFKLLKSVVEKKED